MPGHHRHYEEIIPVREVSRIVPDIQDRGESYGYPDGPDDDRGGPGPGADHRVGSEPGSLSSGVSIGLFFPGEEWKARPIGEWTRACGGAKADVIGRQVTMFRETVTP